MTKPISVKKQLKLIEKSFKPIPGSTVEMFAAVIQASQSALRSFTVDGHAVHPKEMPQVAEKLRNGPLKAYWDSGYGRAAASYHPGGVFFFLPRGVLGDKLMVWASVIIHEAVHCAADMRGQHKPYKLSAYVDEAAAHIAQAIFLQYYKIPLTDLQDNDPVLAAAYPIAAKILSGKVSTVSASQLKNELAAIGYVNNERSMNGFGK